MLRVHSLQIGAVKTLALNVTVLNVLGWAVVGAAIGQYAALRQGFSRTSGRLSGAPWGGFAVLLCLSIGRIWLTERPTCVVPTADVVVVLPRSAG